MTDVCDNLDLESIPVETGPPPFHDSSNALELVRTTFQF